ncbi:KH domain-containing protein [Levilinea saccharolytica]|uniref:RNA-binding protein KhpA n=1 Tax=Levilinea saccharolytica TaxID=229921 RepID=A0A0P6Y2B8_9CHLR|nr:KH domain-containing protein [Levilinea saccharolytica]KPL91821.1 RNA-binding protein [Levilinea saccharolytica]GAP17641.1 RNA-binding protein [Levilinea saccharolytica]
MKELIEYIALSLVEDPSCVQVRQERSGGNKIRFELRVCKEDMGRVIGKNGRVANAMRVLLRVAAAREGKQAILDVVEPR